MSFLNTDHYWKETQQTAVGGKPWGRDIPVCVMLNRAGPEELTGPLNQASSGRKSIQGKTDIV